MNFPNDSSSSPSSQSNGTSGATKHDAKVLPLSLPCPYIRRKVINASAYNICRYGVPTYHGPGEQLPGLGQAWR